ncbi:uncharacterized protein LOC113132319 isoform X2 [Mastacembelus armatus]|uniref:uncharacterized protein LOC113132319 isoform X2 n=1 Tax=Mastacembelus armatus TaxID=205130 RepID=UPI000E463940|nr:uncharacterized protein LOC113132319 isoform X2 [Mastacembelus armatus]
MLLLVQLLMMTMMKTAKTKIIIVSALSGETLLLHPQSDLPSLGLEHRWDVRWTHPHLVLSTKNNQTRCDHGRCELLSNGSLRFSPVQIEDSGNYSLEVFDEEGKRLLKKDFLLQVEDDGQTDHVALLICCFLLMCLLLFFSIFILRRRRIQRTSAAGPSGENVYVMMHGHRGNKKRCEDEKQEREEESLYGTQTVTHTPKQMLTDANMLYLYSSLQRGCFHGNTNHQAVECGGRRHLCVTTNQSPPCFQCAHLDTRTHLHSVVYFSLTCCFFIFRLKYVY